MATSHSISFAPLGGAVQPCAPAIAPSLPRALAPPEVTPEYVTSAATGKGVSEMSAKKIEKPIEKEIASGSEIFVPLNRLKKSPKNARKMPHGEAAIEALAGSIAAKGMLQNLVVEPQVDSDGAETGHYLVTVGEGRRLAQLLRAKRKQIKKSEPIRCRRTRSQR
jgi:hypothetical protein